MSNAEPRLYEGMFLINATVVNSSIAACTEVVQEILTRAHANIQSIHKWDDRKLAYPIHGQKRGIYMLAYFEASPEMIAHIERDVSLSDKILRAMVLKAEHVGETELSLAAEKQKQTQAEAAMGVTSREREESSTAVADEPESDRGSEEDSVESED